MSKLFRDAWFLAWADARNLLRAKETIAWIFLMPPLFFYFIGTVTGGSGRSGDNRDAIAVLAPAGEDVLAEHLLARLEQRNFRVVRTKDEERWQGFRRRLRLPAGMTASVEAGEPVEVVFERGGDAPEAQFDRFRVTRAVYTELADVVVLGMEDRPLTAANLRELRERAPKIEIVVTSAGERLEPPSGFEQAVPGITVMFTLLVLFTGGTVTLVVERRNGLLRRLASSPMSRGAVVAGKWGARMIIGVIQLAAAMLTGKLLFGIAWQPLPAVALLLFAYAALAASLAVLLSTLCRTEGQAIGFGVLLTNILAALGGCWWPIEVTPEWTQQLAMAFPTGWAMDGLHKLMSFGKPALEVAPHVAALAGAGLLAGWAAARRFRFQ